MIMTRSFLLSSLFVSTTAFGQLAPDTRAPLLEHMHEVNAEWGSFNGTADNTAISFINDTERIARHLHLVHSYLVTRTPEGLSDEQAHARGQLLDALGAYADRQVFPKNHVLPYRNPVFIDPYGTACAVGHLMIESGHRALAERIDAGMELAYIRGIDLDEVDQWAVDHGFTKDELAWIQPGYSPTIPWSMLGGGTNGTVDEVLTLSNGDLLVVGQFTDAGGTACNGAARWNGSSYSAMGTLPEGVVNCVVEHGGEIYIGGSFNNGSQDLLHWSDAGWDAEVVFQSKSGEVTALHSHEGMLYAAGGATGFSGVEYGVRARGNGEWEALPGVLNGPIHAMEHHDGHLVAGGSFTGAFLSEDDGSLHVARHTGTGWAQVADGLDGTVHDLLLHDGALYATGDMVSMMGTSFGLASIVAGDDEWSRLMPNIQNYITASPVDAPSVGHAMVVKDERIFIAGDINAYQGLTHGTGLVAYNGEPDNVEPYCNFMGPANSIALVGPDLLVLAGASETFSNIISTDLAAGLNEHDRKSTLKLFPNPAKDHVHVAMPDGLSSVPKVRLTDAAGRTITIDVQATTTGLMIDPRRLASGNYQVEVNDGSHIATGRFIKE